MGLNFDVEIEPYIIEIIENSEDIVFYDYKPFKQNKDM